MNVSYEQFHAQLQNSLAHRRWRLKIACVDLIGGLVLRIAPEAEYRIRVWTIRHLRTDPIMRAWNQMVEERKSA